MAFTRTLCGPNSMAQTRVIMMSPALVKLYTRPPGCGRNPAIDAMLMTTPPPRSIIFGTEDDRARRRRGHQHRVDCGIAAAARRPGVQFHQGWAHHDDARLGHRVWAAQRARERHLPRVDSNRF